MSATTCSVSIDELGRSASPFNGMVEYGTRTFESSLATWPLSALEALRDDVAVADCALLPRTFFVAGRSVPRCSFEALALAILGHHVPDAALDAAGAEWWVQRRPLGRASVLGKRSQHGIAWHFDKDEELHAGTGLYLSPQLSTVTYLSDAGGATVLLDCAAHPATGEPSDLRLAPLRNASCEIARPKTGRHLSFDGRRLHAVVPALGLYPSTQESPRLSFLVNIWIGHSPLAVEPFPDCLLDKLSRPDDRVFRGLGFSFEAPRPPLELSVSDDDADRIRVDDDDDASFVALALPADYLADYGAGAAIEGAPPAHRLVVGDDHVPLATVVVGTRSGHRGGVGHECNSGGP